MPIKTVLATYIQKNDIDDESDWNYRFYLISVPKYKISIYKCFLKRAVNFLGRFNVDINLCSFEMMYICISNAQIQNYHNSYSNSNCE